MTVMIAVFAIRGVSKFIFNHFSLDTILINDSVQADNWIFPIWIFIWYTWEDFIPVITQILIVRSVYNDLKTPEYQIEGSRPSSKVSLETFLLSSEGNNQIVFSFISKIWLYNFIDFLYNNKNFLIKMCRPPNMINNTSRWL